MIWMWRGILSFSRQCSFPLNRLEMKTSCQPEKVSARQQMIHPSADKSIFDMSHWCIDVHQWLNACSPDLLKKAGQAPVCGVPKYLPPRIQKKPRRRRNFRQRGLQGHTNGLR
mmetsp:Transcript_124824/g.186493  ORF Transcript_124824/g.186493 Transcript_124824/m.186493 type:complete len:113 (-) Transcript_124824:654-992(-)